MSGWPIEQLQLEHAAARRGLSRIRREWCFIKVLARHFAVRAAIMLVVLVGGAALFRSLGADQSVSFIKAMWYTWLLIFAEPPPSDFPDSIVLDAMYFLMPIIGLTVIIEGIIDFALMLRDRRRSERSWCVMMAQTLKDHIVIVGFGRLGFSSYMLLRRLGEPVAVIERDGNNQFLEELRRDGMPLLLGDGRREALLIEANIAHAKSIIVSTNDDLANLEIALDARRINPNIRVVLRMFDQNMAAKVGEGFRIHSAMSQASVSAPAFAMSAIDASIIHSFVVGDQLIVMQDWPVTAGGALAGRTVGELMQEHGVSVVRRRDGLGAETLFPAPDARVEPGDHLIVQGRYDVLRRLRAFAASRA